MANCKHLIRIIQCVIFVKAYIVNEYYKNKMRFLALRFCFSNHYLSIDVHKLHIFRDFISTGTKY